MESEEGIALVDPLEVLPGPVEDQEPSALLRLPTEVLDERTALKEETDGADDQWEFDQDGIILGHGKAVHVGRFAHRRRGNGRAAGLPSARAVDGVLAAGGEMGDVVEEFSPGEVVMGVGGRELPLQGISIVHNPHSLQRVGVKLDGKRGFGQGQEAVGDSGDIDARIVRYFGDEQRLDAPEEGAARVGGELRELDPSRLPERRVGSALQEPVGVGYRTAPQGKLV
jgi:hypothetical protein